MVSRLLLVMSNREFSSFATSSERTVGSERSIICSKAKLTNTSARAAPALGVQVKPVTLHLFLARHVVLEVTCLINNVSTWSYGED